MKRYKKGALVKTSDGRFATIIRGSYGHKFMDVSDWEMVNFGMGHMAGSYAAAIDVVCMSTGRKQRLELRKRNFEVVDKS